MQLHQRTFLNALGKRFAAPLSRIACSAPLARPVRAVDAYLNFLAGKGAGAGWDIEHEISAAISLIHRAEPVIFDVGANVGAWSAHARKALPRARLFLFEPSAGCQAQIRARDLPNAKLFPTAVGEKAGTAILHASAGTDESASLHERGESYFQHAKYEQTEIAVCTIDEVVASENIAFVDFLKMDIEGHELFALKGAAESLAARKIGALSFEFGSGNINSRTFFRDLWNLLGRRFSHSADRARRSVGRD